jgi:hypothetical protein
LTEAFFHVSKGLASCLGTHFCQGFFSRFRLAQSIFQNLNHPIKLRFFQLEGTDQFPDPRVRLVDLDRQLLFLSCR